MLGSFAKGPRIIRVDDLVSTKSKGLSWRNFSIGVKLQVAFVAFTAATILTLMGTTAYFNQSAQIESAEETLRAMTEARATQLEQWVENVDSTLLTMASGKQTIDAVYTLSSTFKDLKGDAKSTLQAAYIANNPNPPEKRFLLDKGEGNALYHAEHAKFHKSFRSMVVQNGLYDAFLLNRDGDVVYTVFKEIDFADNLLTGQFSETGLSKIFRQAMEGKAGEIFYSDFEKYAPSNDEFAMFLATPIVSEMGVVVGVLAVQLPMDQINSIIKSSSAAGDSTDIFLVTSGNRLLTDSRFPDRFQAGETLQGLPKTDVLASGEDASHRDVPLQSGNIGFSYAQNISKHGVPWILVSERDRVDVLAGTRALLWTQMMIGGICLAVVAALGVAISRTFSNPIGLLNDSVKKISGGNYDVENFMNDRGDEIGQIAASLADMAKKLASARALEADRAQHQNDQARVVSELTEALRDMADGDLSKSIEQSFPAEYEVLRGYYNQAVQKIADSIEQISAATDGIRAQSSEITRASEELAHRTEVQAATLEQTAAAMDEMTSSVKSAAEGVREVECIVSEARKDADQSGVVVKEAVSAMSEIEKSSDQISQIIGVIDDIAFQTNLLALNAGVEAARAGDAGRGFAVVASEVGALAQRASTAAKEIKNLIGTSSHHVERGVERVKQAGTALQQIAQRVTQISSLTSNIATGAAEQSIGLNEINVGVTQLDQATQKNAAMAEEANAASHLMANGAHELVQLVSRFKLRKSDPIRVMDDIEVNTPMQTSMLAVSNGESFSETRTKEVLTPATPLNSATNSGVWQDF